jgi:hypothetical protein
MATDSLKLGRAWDDVFYDWTDGLNLGRKFKKPRKAPMGKSVWTGARKSVREIAEYSGKGTKADIRARLYGVARKTTQVMVKITPGQNKTRKSVSNHLAYIARDGEETLQDQDGNLHTGKEALKDVSWGWQHTGPLMEQEAQHRLAFNIVFSMPEGTDERALYAAVEAAARVEFAGHQWVMVQHFDEPQVHCHVCVKAEGEDGIRLNPRKADLQRWRERFAHELRERGVQAEATRRASRMHKARIDKPWAATRIEERGGTPRITPEAAKVERIEKWKKTEQQAASSYNNLIEALQRSSEAADRILAKELAESSVGVGRSSPNSGTMERKIERERG